MVRKVRQTFWLRDAHKITNDGRASWNMNAIDEQLRGAVVDNYLSVFIVLLWGSAAARGLKGCLR